MITLDGVLDIETESWDRFVLGGLMRPDRSFESYRDERALVARLLSDGGVWWTWNGGLFDTLWLAENLRAMGLRFTCALAGSRVTRLECDGLIVRDAIALIPMSLKKAAPIAGREIAKDTGLPCSCERPCGGYCSIRRDMPESHYRALTRYLRVDLETEIAVIERIMQEADRAGVLLTGTVGGSAYKTAAAALELEPATWPDGKTYQFARRGYYGGRTEVFQPRASSGFSYDINSAYPAALTRVELPVGPSRIVEGERARGAFRRERPGIYMARIDVPSTLFLPPLPYRTDSGRIIYPVGSFSGTYTGLELRGAIERGCRVSVDRALLWSDSERILAPILNTWWELRRGAREENPALAAWWKWFCNSLTGKLAESPEKERFIVNPRDDEVRLCECPARRGSLAARGDCRCKGWRPLDREGRIWSAPFWRISACGHVHWAAHLTAWTRLALLSQLEADGRGGKSAVYCDTDSCYATEPRTEDIGDDLGEWGDDGRFEPWVDPEGIPRPGFEAIAPKVYLAHKSSIFTVRGKGLPGLDRAGFDRFRDGAPIEVRRGVSGFRSAARAGQSLFTRRSLTRKNHADRARYGGRLLARDGKTYAVTVREFQAWENS